jgi:hypothetical protein
VCYESGFCFVSNPDLALPEQTVLVFFVNIFILFYSADSSPYPNQQSLQNCFFFTESIVVDNIIPLLRSGVDPDLDPKLFAGSGFGSKTGLKSY